MQRGGRGNGDFFGFGDPFAGFGGFGGPGSPFSGIFGGRDPFDDPFFARPFRSVLGGSNMPRSLFENPRGVGFSEDLPSRPKSPRGPIIRELGSDEDGGNGGANGDGVWRSGEYPMSGPHMPRSLFENPQGAGFIENLPPQSENPRGPVIQELGSDEEEENSGANGGGECHAGEYRMSGSNMPRSLFVEGLPSQSKNPRGPVIRELGSDEDNENAGEYPMSGREPYVQHPDEEMEEDEVGDAHTAQRGNNCGSASGPGTTLPPGRNYTFHSSRVTYGGVNGAYYTSSKTRSTGRDGVTVEESKEADVTTGQATHRISRGLHGKGHSLTRRLSSDGRVDTKQTLHNLNEDDIPVFEKAWKGNARRHLPGWNNDSNIFNTGRGEGAFSGSSLPFRRQQWQESDRANQPSNPSTNVPSRRRIFIE